MSRWFEHQLHYSCTCSLSLALRNSQLALLIIHKQYLCLFQPCSTIVLQPNCRYHHLLSFSSSRQWIDLLVTSSLEKLSRIDLSCSPIVLLLEKRPGSGPQKQEEEHIIILSSVNTTTTTTTTIR